VTTTLATQIELDDRGVAWIAGTRVKITEVVRDKVAYGSSPEEIHFQHPNLSLAQIQDALTYYYENQDQVDEQIRRGLEESDKLAVQLSDAEFRHKLLDLKQSRSAYRYTWMSTCDVPSLPPCACARSMLTAQEDGSAELADDLLLNRATELSLVLVS
jgi:uncharacterized protein (DUF433 family)